MSNSGTIKPGSPAGVLPGPGASERLIALVPTPKLIPHQGTEELTKSFYRELAKRGIGRGSAGGVQRLLNWALSQWGKNGITVETFLNPANLSKLLKLGTGVVGAVAEVLLTAEGVGEAESTILSGTNTLRDAGLDPVRVLESATPQQRSWILSGASSLSKLGLLEQDFSLNVKRLVNSVLKGVPPDRFKVALTPPAKPAPVPNVDAYAPYPHTPKPSQLFNGGGVFPGNASEIGKPSSGAKTTTARDPLDRVLTTLPLAPPTSTGPVIFGGKPIGVPSSGVDTRRTPQPGIDDAVLLGTRPLPNPFSPSKTQLQVDHRFALKPFEPFAPRGPLLDEAQRWAKFFNPLGDKPGLPKPKQTPGGGWPGDPSRLKFDPDTNGSAPPDTKTPRNAAQTSASDDPPSSQEPRPREAPVSEIIYSSRSQNTRRRGGAPPRRITGDPRRPNSDNSTLARRADDPNRPFRSQTSSRLRAVNPNPSIPDINDAPNNDPITLSSATIIKAASKDLGLSEGYINEFGRAHPTLTVNEVVAILSSPTLTAIYQRMERERPVDNRTGEQITVVYDQELATAINQSGLSPEQINAMTSEQFAQFVSQGFRTPGYRVLGEYNIPFAYFMAQTLHPTTISGPLPLSIWEAAEQYGVTQEAVIAYMVGHPGISTEQAALQVDLQNESAIRQAAQQYNISNPNDIRLMYRRLLETNPSATIADAVRALNDPYFLLTQVRSTRIKEECLNVRDVISRHKALEDAINALLLRIAQSSEPHEQNRLYIQLRRKLQNDLAHLKENDGTVWNALLGALNALGSAIRSESQP